MKIQVQSIHFDSDKKLLDFITKKLEKLEVFFDQIINIDVILKLENTGQVRDKIAEVKLYVPGETLIVKETSKSFEESIDNASNILKRQLIRHKERSRA